MAYINGKKVFFSVSTVGTVKSVDGITPDENGNIALPYADDKGNGGKLRLKHTYGIGSGRYGGNSPAGGDTAVIVPANEGDIIARTQKYKPIVPNMLDYAVKMALTKSKTKWTEAEKQAARELLGIVSEKETILDNATIDIAGCVTGAQLEVGAKYIVSVYWNNEQQYIVKNVECTALANQNCPPDSNGYTSLVCACVSNEKGAGEMYIQQTTENDLRVTFLYWVEEDGESMPCQYTEGGTITIIKVNE